MRKMKLITEGKCTDCKDDPTGVPAPIQENVDLSMQRRRTAPWSLCAVGEVLVGELR